MRSTALALVLTSLATPILAQELTFGKISVEYGNADTVFGDNNSRHLDGKAEVSFGNAIAGIDANRFSSTFVSARSTYELFAGYRISNLTIGARFGSEGKSGSMTDYWGLWLGYEQDQFAVGFDAKKSDGGRYQYVLAGEANVTDAISVAGYASHGEGDGYSNFALNGRYDSGAISADAVAYETTGGDVDLFGVSGQYQFNDNIDLGAGLGERKASGSSGNIAAFVSAGYSFAPGVRGEAMYKWREDDVTTIQLGFRVDFGKSARVADRVESRIDDLKRDFE